jgi:hypothetical protein
MVDDSGTNHDFEWRVMVFLILGANLEVKKVNFLQVWIEREKREGKRLELGSGVMLL